MKYPKVYAGVKKIYSSQILSLIAAALVFAGVIAGAFLRDYDALSTAQMVLFTTVMLASGVLNVIAYLKHINGVRLAAKDVPAFRKALMWLIIGIVASVAKSILESTELEALGLMMNVVFTLAAFLGAYFTVYGIIDMAEAEEDYAFKATAETALRRIIFTKVLSIIGTGAEYIFREFFASSQSTFMYFLPYIITAFVFVMDLLFYIFVLRILKQTKTQLEKI